MIAIGPVMRISMSITLARTQRALLSATPAVLAGLATAAAMLGPPPAQAQAPQAAAPQAVAESAEARFDAARDAYETGHYPIAFAAFAQLADEGHCEATRIARLMLRLGRPLYATEFEVAPLRLERWRALPCPTALAGR